MQIFEKRRKKNYVTYDRHIVNALLKKLNIIDETYTKIKPCNREEVPFTEFTSRIYEDEKQFFSSNRQNDWIVNNFLNCNEFRKLLTLKLSFLRKICVLQVKIY